MIKTKAEPFTLPVLPYEQNELEPYLSARMIGFHHGKHHQSYVNKLNELVSGSELAELKLEEIIVKTAGDANQRDIFNNAAQAWNHTFCWNSLSPVGGRKMSGAFGRKIEDSFGSYENFVKEFSQAGMEQFGSGWVWLVKEDGILKIVKTPNAENPISQGRGIALLTLDVWEHAYYLDYQSRRNDYLTTVLEKLINWNFAVENLEKA
ncbi:MAG: superoxide dismutase [Omnitrophica bacterium GWA2_50_21]|nr:MAG: superoxide dismutase [Omnitrophica bacterium GWA2_50_21]